MRCKIINKRRIWEAKPSAREQDNYLTCKDLLKVAVFCKEALGSQLMEGTLGIQIVGRTIRFYLLVLPASGLYGMIELADIKILDSLESLPSLITEVAKAMKVLDTFDRACIPACDTATTLGRRTGTMSMAKFDQFFTMSRNREKPCHIKLRHN